MNIIKSGHDLLQACHELKSKIALVPTMGALHEGHIALGKLARLKAENVIYSIFVNPTQFGAGEDFDKYPRDIQADKAKLKGIADYIYTPNVEDIYPEGVKITHRAGASAQGLCGGSRPGHFDGVVTVVAKLFAHTLPDIAIFGEKDYQQLMVIKEMGFRNAKTGELIEIIGAPIIREKSGLAMSSRNAYLSTEERKIAPSLYKIISSTSNQQLATSNLEAAGFRVDYVEQRWNRILAAVWLGKTRLIDNVAIS